MQLSIHRITQNDSIKGEVEEACYAALEGASKISLYWTLKTAWKVDGPLVSAIEGAPKDALSNLDKGTQ